SAVRSRQPARASAAKRATRCAVQASARPTCRSSRTSTRSARRSCKSGSRSSTCSIRFASISRTTSSGARRSGRSRPRRTAASRSSVCAISSEAGMTKAFLTTAIATAVAALLSAQPPAAVNNTLTSVDGVKVGHFTLSERPTGCTAIIVKDGTTGGVDVRGGAPGTRETDVLNPVNNVQIVNGISLSGGSAYGLDTATGVMRWLEEHKMGYPVGAAGIVPIVPAAILFDLPFGGKPQIRPTADCGYKAASAATSDPVQEGNVGAGAGATVGKTAGRPMKAGVGSSAIRLPNGLIVAALVAVNASGDIIDPATGQVIAGTRTADNRLADARKLLRSGGGRGGRAGENTTIGVVATNAKLTKVQATKMAQMAHDGYARAI